MGDDDAPAVERVLQWDRASSARKAWKKPMARPTRQGFNGTGLHQPGRRATATRKRSGKRLQWDRASSARKAWRDYRLQAFLLASMGPGFISPEGGRVVRSEELNQQASMGPGFISPEGRIPSRPSATVYWGFNGTGLHQPGRPNYTEPASGIKIALQWDRASSARKAWGVLTLSLTLTSFNGTGLHQPGRPQHRQVQRAQLLIASMGPGFISPEGDAPDSKV